MVKKCIVEYDELGNPIGLIDLKEFTDNKSLKEFEQLCKENREKYLKRKEEKDSENRSKEQGLLDEMKRLSLNLEKAMCGIAYLMGVADFENIEDFFESYVKGELKNEKED